MYRLDVFGEPVTLPDRASVEAWNAARVTRKALLSLTDAQLDDVGLCPGDIQAVAAGRFRRR